MEIKIFDEYYATDDGKIVSYKRGYRNILKPSINHKGYEIVNLMINGKPKGFSVHVLIAKAFIPNPENKPQVNHKNGIKTNNTYTNLEWATASENMQHSFDVLGRKQHNIKRIKIEQTNTEFDSIMDCAKYLIKVLDIDSTNRQVQNCINRVLKGYRKSYKGLVFLYV